jgi:hypothetical protein
MGCSGSKEARVSDPEDVVVAPTGKLFSGCKLKGHGTLGTLMLPGCASEPSVPAGHPAKDSSTRARRLSLAIEAKAVRGSSRDSVAPTCHQQLLAVPAMCCAGLEPTDPLEPTEQPCSAFS